MIGKDQYWKAAKMKCQDCEGDSEDDSVCRDMAGHGECPLFVYKGNPKRRGPDGKMLPLFRKKEVKKRMREACRVCMNNNPINLCRAYTCPIHDIVREGRKQGKGEGFSGDAAAELPKPRPTKRSSKKPIRAADISSNINGSAKTVANSRRRSSK